MRILDINSYSAPKHPIVKTKNLYSVKKSPSLLRYAYKALVLAPLLFAVPSLKSQNEMNSDQYVNIKIGEKNNKKANLKYYHNKTYDFTDSAIYANGVIEDFKQGTMPDCSLLSVIKGLSLTPNGKKLMKSLIEPMPDGSFQVEICDDSDSNVFKVTRKDFFAPENKELSTLDDDVKIIEIAFRKYCKANNTDFLFSPSKAFQLIACSLPDYSISAEDKNKAFIETVGDQQKISPNISSVYDLFDNILKMDNESRKHIVFICSTKDKDIKYGLFNNHSYYVTNIKLKKVNDDLYDGVFTLNNPHSTADKQVKLNMKQFLESINNIDFLKLDFDITLNFEKKSIMNSLCDSKNVTNKIKLLIR